MVRFVTDQREVLGLEGLVDPPGRIRGSSPGPGSVFFAAQAKQVGCLSPKLRII